MSADNEPGVFQNDVRELLLALGLGDQARPISCHEVMQREILPAVRALIVQVDTGEPK